MTPRSGVTRELVREWLRKAATDLGVARHLLEQSSFYSAVGFHAQQAVEKYLKALLVHHQIEFPKTHNIDLLLDLAAPADQTLVDALRQASVLTQYGVEIRYPGDAPDVSEDEAGEAVSLAAKVGDAVTSQTGSGTE